PRAFSSSPASTAFTFSAASRSSPLLRFALQWANTRATRSRMPACTGTSSMWSGFLYSRSFTFSRRNRLGRTRTFDYLQNVSVDVVLVAGADGPGTRPGLRSDKRAIEGASACLHNACEDSCNCRDLHAPALRTHQSHPDHACSANSGRDSFLVHISGNSGQCDSSDSSALDSMAIRRLVTGISIAVIVLLLQVPGFAQGCAMCRAALEQSAEGRLVAGSFAHGIIMMLVLP